MRKKSLALTAVLFISGVCPVKAIPPTYTIGNNTPTTVYFIQGQSFTPTIQGNLGTGVAATSGNVELVRFSLAFQNPTTAPGSLYIYSFQPTIAQVNNSGQGSLGVGANTGTGVYLFSGLVLQANTKYYAVLPTQVSIFDGSGHPYAGGLDLYPQPVNAPTSIDEGLGGFDAGFTATFEILPSPPATPAPSSIWLMLAGLTAIGFYLGYRRLRGNQFARSDD
ncbi:MAG: hypothetical protein ACLPWF_06505 [Bryobacteraceae bacterium]